MRQVIEQVGREKGIDRKILIDAVGAAILSASRKTLGPVLELRVEFDQESGGFKVYAVRKVVEKVLNPKVEISVEDAQRVNPEAKASDEVRSVESLHKQPNRSSFSGSGKRNGRASFRASRHGRVSWSMVSFSGLSRGT